MTIKTYSAKSAATRAAKKIENANIVELRNGRWGLYTDLAELGKFGFGTNDDDAACPHCGINHRDNGYAMNDEEYECDEREYACLGCGGEWGAEINEPQPNSEFAELFAHYGGTEKGGICRALRAIAVQWTGKRREFLAEAANIGLNTGNAAAEWQAARRKAK